MPYLETLIHSPGCTFAYQNRPPVNVLHCHRHLVAEARADPKALLSDHGLERDARPVECLCCFEKSFHLAAGRCCDPICSGGCRYDLICSAG